MDFHSLTRKELQSLCKQHRIPANTTNVAMAEALQALLDVGEMEGIVQDTLQNVTPKISLASAAAPIRSSRRTSARRPADAVAHASVEPKDQPASPLPRARRVTARVSEIRRLVSEDDVEGAKGEVLLVENTPIATTVKRGRRTSKKENDDIKEEGAVETAKTPVTRNGRRMTSGKGAETKAVEQDETDDTVLSWRTTTRRTRQSSKAIVVDVTTTAKRRSTTARASASLVQIETLAPEAEQVEKDIKLKVCAERDGDSSFPTGEKTMDWETGDVDAKDGNLVVVEDRTGEPEAEAFADMKELEAVTQEKEYELAKGYTDDKYEECHLVEVDTEIYQHRLTTEVEEVDMAAPEADGVVVLEGLTQEKGELVKEESDELAQDEVAWPKGVVVNIELENVAQEKEDEVVSPLTEEIDTVKLENEAREKEFEEKGSLDKEDQCIDSLLPSTEKILDLVSMAADDNSEQECNLEVNDKTSPHQQFSIQIEEHGTTAKEAEEFAEVELEVVAQEEEGDEETEKGFEIKFSLKRGDDVDEEVSDSAEFDISNICSMDLKDIVEERTKGDEDEIVNRKDCEKDINAIVANLPEHELIVNVKDGMTRDAPVITEEKEPNKTDNEFLGSEGSPVLGLLSSLEKLTILGDAGDKQNKEVEERRLALLPEDEISTETDISITLDQVSIDAGNEKLDEVIGYVVNSEIARSNNVDLPAEIVGKAGNFQESLDVIFEVGKGEEKSQEFEANKENGIGEIAVEKKSQCCEANKENIGEVALENGAEKNVPVDLNEMSLIKLRKLYKENGIGEVAVEKKSQCCEANKENIGEVALEKGAEKNVPVDLNEMSLIKLRKLYKEKINNINKNRVEGRRLALTEINDNIES